MLRLPLNLVPSTGQWHTLTSSFIHLSSLLALISAGCLLVCLFHRTLTSIKLPCSLSSIQKCLYATFLKPHQGQDQQTALENFYNSQADVYDASRRSLLRGREDMLSLVAAQLRYRQENGSQVPKPVWVDLGGGTGYNIEAMGEYLDVPSFFDKVILVDLSPSLLDIARRRFKRLGWEVEVICQDARYFHLRQASSQEEDRRHGHVTADLITMSYSLSMIPDYYNVLDHVSTLLAPTGLVGVVDFYVQSIVEIQGRNYTGGTINRHVTWLGRLFWRAWFDLDRVGLEGARRDYLEYKYGTLKTVDQRNWWLGGIPYYSKNPTPPILVDIR